MPVVSVITACHTGRQRFLDQAAQSVLSQALPPSWQLEWCLQFDGEEMPHEVEFGDSRVLIGSNGAHLGPGETRNRAIAQSTGEVLIQLDGDDMFVDDALLALLPRFDEKEIGWVVGRADDLHLDGSTEAFVPAILGHIPIGRVSGYWLEGHLMPFHSAGFCARRNLVLSAGGYPNIAAAEDVAMLLAVTDASPGHVIATLTTLYRKWLEQTTASPDYYARHRETCLRQIEHTVRTRFMP